MVYSISFLLSGWFKVVTMLNKRTFSCQSVSIILWHLGSLGVARCLTHPTKTCALPASSESQITGSPQHIFLLHMSVHISHSYRQSSSSQLTNPNNKKQLNQAINFPNMNQIKSTKMRTASQTLLILDKLTQKLVLHSRREPWYLLHALYPHSRIRAPRNANLQRGLPQYWSVGRPLKRRGNDEQQGVSCPMARTLEGREGKGEDALPWSWGH